MWTILIERFGMNLTDLRSKNKIWIVSELFYPETISTAYIMTEIAKSLSTEYKVEIICGSIFYEKKTQHTLTLKLVLF